MPSKPTDTPRTDDEDYQIPELRLGVRDAKANLSRALREVKQGKEVVITEYGKAIARLVPVRALSLEERLAELERRGEIEPAGKALGRPLRPFEVPEGLAERLLEEGREWPRK